MNLSSNSLKALVIGLALAGATSCEKGNVKEELEVTNCTEECSETGVHNHPMPNPEPCPTCGMG